MSDRLIVNMITVLSGQKRIKTCALEFLLLFLAVSSELRCAQARPKHGAGGAANMNGVVVSDVLTWTQVSVALVASLCIVVIVIGCADLCRKSGFQNFQNDEPCVVTPPPVDRYALFPPVESTPEPVVSTAPIYFEPLPDIRPKPSQRLSNADLLKPKVAPVHEDGRANSAGAEDVLSDKLKLQNYMHSNTRYPIQRSSMQYIKELGGGWFGKALQGEGSRIQPGHRKTKVVVKMLKDDASLPEQLLFFQEVTAYREIDNPHILKLLGQCTETTPLLLVMEQCPFGDLKSYLCSHHVAVESFSEKGLLLKFACDMAAGLQCLHQHNFVHRDFATRNCLLGSDLSVKVGDYGVSEDVYKDDYYTDKSGEAIPIRWLPPESVEYHHSREVTLRPVTKESNVWSYGIAIWEVAQFGSVPFSDLSDEQVLRMVHRERCLKPSRPDTAVLHMDRLYQLMQFCWSEPSQRPSLRELRIMLLHLLSRKTDVDSSAFDLKWNQLLPKKTPRTGRATSPVGNGTVQTQNHILESIVIQPAQVHRDAEKFVPTDGSGDQSAIAATPSGQKPELVLSIQDELSKTKSSSSAAPVGSPINELSLEQELAAFGMPANENATQEDPATPTSPANDVLDASFETDAGTPNRSFASTQPDSLILEIERISEEIGLEKSTDDSNNNDGADIFENANSKIDPSAGVMSKDSSNFTTSTPKVDDKSGVESRNSDYHTAPSMQLSVDFSDSSMSLLPSSSRKFDNYRTRNFSDYLATVATSMDINDINDELDSTILDSSGTDLSLLTGAIEESEEPTPKSDLINKVETNMTSSDMATSTSYQTAEESAAADPVSPNTSSSNSEQNTSINSEKLQTAADDLKTEVDSKDSASVVDDVTVKISTVPDISTHTGTEQEISTSEILVNPTQSVSVNT